MSTILLADDLMCADTRMTGSIINDGCHKIVETPNAVYGIAGSGLDMDVLVATFEMLITPMVDGEDGEAIMVPTIEVAGNLEESALVYFVKATGETGKAACDDKGFMRKVKMPQPIALGSGGDLALMAYKCDLSPEESVRKVFGLDPYTGGDVEVIECKRL